MQSNMILPLVLTLSVTATGQVPAESFEYRVKHDHSVGSCEGELMMNDRGIHFEASNNKHSQRWAYLDIQKLDVSSGRIRLETYQSQGWKKLGKDKTFEFSLLESQLTAQTQEFLRSKLRRPMVARLAEAGGTNQISLPVRHRHRLGGCEGMLHVEKDHLTYSTNLTRDNRVWKFNEIETIGSPDPYHLRITSYLETYTFDLKTPVEDKVYDFLWARLNRLEAARLTQEEQNESP